MHLTKPANMIMLITERRIGSMLWKMIGVLLFKGVMASL